MFDLLIKNGNIADGTGNLAYKSDVAIKDGKIVRISQSISEDAVEIIDAEGLAVTPGFIDSHSHSDGALFDYPDMTEKIEQGITTSISGQCGSSPAPISKDINEKNATEFKGYGKSNEFLKTFGTMVNAIKDTSLGSNLKSFVGHSAIRTAVIGYENRKPTEAEMNQMKVLLAEAMENGAVGLSFGLIYTPSCYAQTDELIELAKVVKQYDGILSAHIRNEGFELIEAVEEFLTVIKTVGIRAVFSHHKSMYKPNWGKVQKSLALIKAAVDEGYDIYCDVYPYEASSTSLSATIIAKELRALNNEGIVKMLKDDTMRDKIREAYISKNGNSLSNLLVTKCVGHPEYEGLRVDEIAKLRGQDDFDAAFDLISASGATAHICNFSMCEDDIELVLKYERTMICTDSSVAKADSIFHPRLKASFPRFFGRYVRERKLIPFEEAIRKCTSLPSFVYGLSSKGIICEGYDADICIFDPERIIDKADYVNCNKRCVGLNYVILGGEKVCENAIYNGNRKGRFILSEYVLNGDGTMAR